MTHANQSPARPALEMADIFREYGAAYRANHDLPLSHLKAMSAIESCRSAVLGGHLFRCEECGHEQPEYNSCRNRHCPKCQGAATEKWIKAREKELLPVPYFHIVFTLPSQLRELALINQKIIYGILFKAASETLLTLGRDPRHIGGMIGLTAVLHTWGRNMIDHPHLHCIVPGGALSDDGRQWLQPKKSGKDKKFFVHVNVISDLFKKKFLHYLLKAYRKGKLKFEGQIANLQQPGNFTRFKNSLYGRKWVTYCKRPFGGPAHVLAYLGRYTHRVAIGNHRLIRVEASLAAPENGRVYFKWKDSKSDGKLKETSLAVDEFIRRFLLHILPDGFMKIRHFGFLSNRHKRDKLAKCRELLGELPESTEAGSADDDSEVYSSRRVCACCGSEHLLPRREIAPIREFRASRSTSG